MLEVARYGGWSPVKQKGTAPSRWGTWAFVANHIEPYLAYASNERGFEIKSHLDSRMGRHKRFANSDLSFRLKRGRIDGPVYSKIEFPGSVPVNGWFYGQSRDLALYLKGPYLNKRFACYARQENAFRKAQGVKNASRIQSILDMPRFSKDDYEVFIPHTTRVARSKTNGNLFLKSL